MSSHKFIRFQIDYFCCLEGKFKHNATTIKKLEDPKDIINNEVKTSQRFWGVHETYVSLSPSQF